MATDDVWNDKGSGERQERTEWHNIVAWDRLAEICNQYLTKGRLVYIEGSLQTREWDDQEGNKRKTTEIRARDMVLLGGGAGENSGAGQRRPAVADAAVAGSTSAPATSTITDDDIPF
jgi:single-strand DNA-binding protein